MIWSTYAASSPLRGADLEVAAEFRKCLPFEQTRSAALVVEEFQGQQRLDRDGELIAGRNGTRAAACATGS